MYEYEITFKSDPTDIDFLYGYSLNDLRKRYPERDFDDIVIISREYID